MDFVKHRYTVNIAGKDVEAVFPSRRHTPEGGKPMKVYDIEIEFEAVRSGKNDVWAFAHVMINGTRDRFWGGTREVWDFLADTHRLPGSVWRLVAEISAVLPDAVPSPWATYGD